jgi:hypothetical protein
MSFNLSIDVRAFESEMEQLAERADKAARPATQAGAQVLYERVKVNVASLGRKTGNLDSSIYQAYSADNSNESKAVYHISWNATKAPHGHLVEWGYIKRWQSIMINGKWVTLKNRPLATPVQVPGKAFMRRAKDAFPMAEEAMRAKFLEVLHGG